MSLKIGIVGLPNVGKSTLFNALVKGSHAEAANYPFCTIEPNVGIVEVPDERIKPLSNISKSQKTVPAVVEFVDIAGLVKGASTGEGLGNKFLAHIRECAAIALVVRFFEDKNVTHVSDKLEPMEDIKTIETELQLADLQLIEKLIFNAEKEKKAGEKDAGSRLVLLDKIRSTLNNGHNASDLEELKNLEIKKLKNLEEQNLLTMKPIIYIANCSEEQLANFQDTRYKIQTNTNDKNSNIQNLTANNRQLTATEFIPISAKIESELNALGDADPSEAEMLKREYLEGIGISDSGINRLIREAYRTLGLITYFTSGEKESRAWTIKAGSTAPQAAGVIHTDFERGFIAADVVKFDDFVKFGGWSGARSHGRIHTEGKSYIVSDDDIMLFRFNV